MTLYEEFLTACAREIRESLETIANNNPPIFIDSILVGEVLFGLDCAYGILIDQSGRTKITEKKGFDEFYGQLKTTQFYADISDGRRLSNTDHFVGDDLYERFVSCFANTINNTLETLADGRNVVDIDYAFVDVLVKMGYARKLPYSLHGEDGFTKTEKFDEFYQRFKETKLYGDALGNVKIY